MMTPKETAAALRLQSGCFEPALNFGALKPEGFTLVFDSVQHYSRITRRPELICSGTRDGCTLVYGPLRIILYNENAPGGRTRRRFTEAHELGHILLEHTADDKTAERAADAFAAELLMPEVLVREAMRLCTLTPSRAAELFDVSLSAAETRLRQVCSYRCLPSPREQELLRRTLPALSAALTGPMIEVG